jgi:putative transposase
MSELSPLLPEITYHIYNHANGDENLFRTDENYRYFLQKYGEYIYPIAETYAYCLMPNHFHLMVQIRSEEEVMEFFRKKDQPPKDLQAAQDLTGFQNLSGLISQQFGHFFNAYTKAYNKMYDRRGSLFERPFKRKAVKNDRYFTQLIAYIHLNPIKHRFCKHILDWPHSSIHAYYHDKASKLNRSYLQEWFGDKESLIAFHDSLEVDDSLFEF